MPISITRYVDITSFVGASSAVAERQLIARLFDDNNLIPTNSMIDFTSATDVGNYFGLSSEEYNRALFYFSFISKNATRPQSITFARWIDADVAPMIFGAVKSQLLSTYTAITSGSFSMTIGGVTHSFTGLDFSAAVSLANVASIIQTAINAESGTQWTAATVTYNSTRNSFNFVGGDAVVADISVNEGTSGTPIAAIIGWLAGAILSDGALTQTITEVLTSSAQTSNNFGSFLFIPTLSIDQVTEAATWNYGQNVNYEYMVRLENIDNAAPYNAALANLGGTGITLATLSGEYDEELPMAIMAATNYDAANSVQNYMFQQANLTAKVTDDTTANLLDGYRINYYGQTQNAGQDISFYQRGILMGPTTSPLDMGAYANECWLKSALTAALMNLLLGVSQVPASNQGRGMIIANMQPVINQAVNNGTISAGKTLTQAQITYIGEITNNPNAWQQVQSLGYWLDVSIVPFVVDSVTQYKAVYTLIYSKDDVIRSVEGSDILI
jgi:hypothetical protein